MSLFIFLCNFVALAFSTSDKRISWKNQFWHFQVVLMKICQIPHVIFQTTSQILFKFCTVPQCHEIYFCVFLCIFLGQALHILYKRDQSKCNFFRLLSAGIKIHQILVIFETKISFSSNFAPLFGIMRHISSILFLAETLYTFSKSSLSKYKFGEISPEQSKVWNFALWWAPFVKIK